MFVLDNFILFVVVGCCCWSGDGGAAKQKIPLHELMTQSEREYYFGTFDGGSRGAAPEYQLVYLPAVLPRAASSDGSQDDLPIEYSFSALGRDFNLELKPNRLLLSPDFKVFSNGASGIHHEPYLSEASSDCHYLHRRDETVAAISTCKGNTLHGVIVTPNSSFEIRPLSAALTQRVRRTDPWSGAELALRLATHPHLVRRAPPLPHPFADDFLPLRKRAKPRSDWTSEPESAQSETVDDDKSREHRAHQPAGYTLEVALFMDEAAYNIFYPYFDRNEKDVRDLMLAYMNGVQALYHHPSLGTRLDISLVRLELQRRQPSDLPHHGGERGALLDSFCAYQAALNEEDDAHPDHWDMALYVSGLDFFAYENGRKSGVTMGLATVGGVCLAPYACVIAELGATNVFGKPYPSAGFTSVYILAHEIGHNLGMHHDSSGNSCSKDGFIMSPSRGTDGESLWSPCSAQVMTQLSWAKCLQDRAAPPKPDLDHAQHGDAPGAAWGAKRQCEVLLRDRDAAPVGAAPCRQLQCRSPHRAGFYFAGPALPGTPCGNYLWCQGGECVRRETTRPPSVWTPAPVSWGAWRAESCASGCLRRARGHQRRRRHCGSDARGDACAGSAYDVVLCDDEKLCAKKTRVSATEYAGRKCREFSAMLPELDPAGGGLQAPHEEGRPWMGCAIFCRRVDSGGYYAPRVDLNDLGADPYFPDGTWCHADAYQNYFCLQHHCLPESFKFTKSAWIWDLQPDDLPLLGNAEPEVRPMPDDLRMYLSLDDQASPLTRIAPGGLQATGEDEWIDIDYVELPKGSEENVEDN